MSAVCVLFLAAFSKAYSAASRMLALDLPDPVLLAKTRYVLLAVAVVEMIAGAGILASRRIWLRGLILLWLGGNFLLYRSALLLGGAGTPCPCLGNVAAQLGLSASVSEMITRVLACYVVIAGAYLLYTGRPRLHNCAPC